MMYIEQAPLGGNLLKILKNSASLSNGTEKATNAVNAFRVQNGNCKTEFLSGASEKRAINEIAKLHSTPKSLLQKEEEEEPYELIDVIDDSDNLKTDQEEAENNTSNGFEIIIDLEDTLKNEETENDQHNNNGDEERYELRLVRIPKRQLKTEQKAGFTVIKPSKPKLRPVPDAIPIERYQIIPEKRLLNGLSSRDLAANVDQSVPDTSTYNCFETGLEHRAFDNILNRDEQMGIDILNGIRHLFNWKRKTSNTETAETPSGSRKRRADNLANDANFKYRKVDNNFPKVITRTLDDDFSTPYHRPVSTNRNLMEFPNFPQSKTSNFDFEKPDIERKSRKSWFNAPLTTNKIIRNTYADVEFSDDDDDDDGGSARRLRQNLGINVANANGTSKPKVINIPIRREQQPSGSYASLKPTFLPPLPSLARIPPNNSFNIGAIPKPTYSEALRYNIPSSSGGMGLTLNGRPYSSNTSSGGSGTSTSRYGKDFSNMMRLNAKAMGRSIVNQDREAEDHAKYKQLLDTISRAQNGLANQFLLPNVTKKPRTATKYSQPLCTPRAPLSSTVNIEDDDEYDDVEITGVGDGGLASYLKQPKQTGKRETRGYASIVINDDDDDISEIIDMGREQSKNKTIVTVDLEAKENKRNNLPYVEPVNSFRERVNVVPKLRDEWLQMFNAKWDERRKLRDAEVCKTLQMTGQLTAERRVAETELQQRLKDFRIVDPELLVVDDFAEPEKDEPVFPELNPERQQRIKEAIYGPPDQVLVEKFNMSITRRDIQTLLGHNWLNDEVINFYMNLLTERSEKKHNSHGFPTVYAMNTFFLQRLSQNGHGGVKRWTRKVNIFEKDVIPVPVHVGGVHWCMAIIHLRNQWIRYYDSMGAPNPSVLKLLEQYLKDESLDKRKEPFDTSGFVIESVRDVPRQMNGSDCGVFSCMFAEYVTRNKDITFSQEHMEYFRHKMILEIVQGELLL